MKKLLIILFLLPFFGFAQTTTFNLSQTPLSTDFLNADRGAHLWINRDAPFGTIDIPVNDAPEQMVDGYYRFLWTHFFTGTGLDSTINWSFFRARMGEFTAKRMGIKFRIMANGSNIGNPPGDNFNNLQQYDGGWNGVPEFLHNLQQAESNAANRDFESTFGGSYNTWVPNTNSPQFRRWIRKFSQQLRNYIDTAVINGHPLRFAIRIYDLGYYGCFSEQHSACLCNTLSDGNIPAGARPNREPDGDDNLMDIVDAQLDAMGANPNWKYVIPFNSLDAVWLGHTLNSVAYGQYLIDHSDSISFVNDHLGANEGYDHDYWENNNRLGSRAGTPRQTILNNRWRYSPHGGEPVGWGAPADRSAIPLYVQTLHLSGFGNGNLDHITDGPDDDWPTEANNIRTASRLAGYRLKVTGGSATVGANLSISLNWINEGNAPVYFPWTVQYLIKNGAGSTVSTLTSSFQVRYFQPQGASNNITQAFTMPAIPVGSYGLYVKVVDANAYRNPMFLANTPRQTDGSYFLGNITLGGGTNQSPTVNAGPNQSISISSATVTAIASDPDGTIASYLWSQVPGGPNTATIVSPTTASTSITGLIGGTYTFNVTVTDDDGATASDQVQITVGGNQPPVANAGPNVTLTLPTNFTQLNGTGSTDDVAIASYHWQKISGPVTYSCLLCPANSIVNAESLQLGTYIFRLTVVDASGLSSFDDVQITVLGPNSPPISNAGPNQTITLPTSSVTLDGTGSFDAVGITAYLWTQVGGSAGPTIVSPTSSSTSVTGLAAGVYVFRLRVEDVEGLFSIDDVQITVNAVASGTPVANAGPNQTITLPTSSVTLTSAASTDDVAIVSRVWQKVSGPTPFTIVSPTSVSTSVTGLVQGVYVFRITVTDGGGLTDSDEVTITVNAASNEAPIANAGGSQSITLPTSEATLDGSASTDDVGIVTYSWTKISGPLGCDITTEGSAITTVTGLVEGTYVFRLTVTDGPGLTDFDDVTIIVNAAANNSPVAVITTTTPIIQLPTSSVTLDGTGSTDDIMVTGYLFTQISGPNTATITTPGFSSTSVTGLVQGVYFFQLIVTDGSGLTDTDEIMITVNAAEPVRPILDGHTLMRTGVKFLPRHGHP